MRRNGRWRMTMNVRTAKKENSQDSEMEKAEYMYGVVHWME